MNDSILFYMENLDLPTSIGRKAMLTGNYTELGGYIGNFGAIGGIGDLTVMLHGFKCKAVELGCDNIYISELPIYITPRIYSKDMRNKIKPEKNYPITKKSHVPFLLKENVLDYLNIKLINKEITYKYKIQPLRNKYMKGSRRELMSNGGFFVYLDYYVRNYNKLEHYSPDRETPKKKYVIMQYRNVKKEDQYNYQRGIEKDYLLKLYDNLKSILGDEYEFWKIGEEFSEEDKEIEDLFDNVIPMDYGNLLSLFKIIRNSSLTVALHSGIACLGRLFNIPTLEVSIFPYTTRDIHKMRSRKLNIPKKIPSNFISRQGHERYSDQMWYERAGAPQGTRYLETYNDVAWGGFFTQYEPPPDVEYLKQFLSRNNLI